MRWPWEQKTPRSEHDEIPDQLIELVGRVHEAAGQLQTLLEELRTEMEHAGARPGD